MNPRRDALAAISAAIRAADPESLVTQKVRLHGHHIVAGNAKVDLSHYRRILVIGGGKAVVGMVAGVERILGKRITDGVVNVPIGLSVRRSSKRVGFNPSTHPHPSPAGMSGVKKMLSLVGAADTDDLVICLVSGGASSMMSLPTKGLPLSDKGVMAGMLMNAGASVGEVNVVRRHLSQIKGGRLAERLFPATVLTLIVSDVVDNRLEDIGSGPTAPDPSTYLDAKRVLEKYRVWRRIPEPARKIIQKGISGLQSETPKPGSEVFQRVFNVLVGENRNACLGAAKSLYRNGYKTVILTRRLVGDARQAGQFLSGAISSIDDGRFSLRRPVARVAGGETTVQVRGRGRGGRNQELVLSAALGIQGMLGTVVASVGTDGRDGTTEAAGALADSTTVQRGLGKGMRAESYLDDNDSHDFFLNLKDLIVTGPTGTNVSDIAIAVAGLRSYRWADPTPR